MPSPHRGVLSVVKREATHMIAIFMYLDKLRHLARMEDIELIIGFTVQKQNVTPASILCRQSLYDTCI